MPSRTLVCAVGDVFVNDDDPHYGFSLVAPLLAEADMVGGWRMTREDPAFRSVISGTFNRLVLLTLDIKVRDADEEGGEHAALHMHRGQRDDARGHRQDNEPGKEHIFPDSVGNEWRAISFRQFVVLVFIGCSSHNASRHRPFVNTQFHHHQ